MILIGDGQVEQITVLERNGYRHRERARARSASERRDLLRRQRWIGEPLSSASTKAAGTCLPREIHAAIYDRREGDSAEDDPGAELPGMRSVKLPRSNWHAYVRTTRTRIIAFVPLRIAADLSRSSRASMLLATGILRHSIIRCQPMIISMDDPCNGA